MDSLFQRWRRSKWSQFIDVIVGTVLFLVVYFPLNNKTLGEIIAVVTALLAASRFAIAAYVEDQLDPIKTPIKQITNIVDVQQQLNVDDIKNLFGVYISITEPEFRQVKESLLAETMTKLKQLAQQKRSDELSTGDYYQWLLPILQGVRPGETVRAVSLMFDAEWDDSPPERKFFDENLDAAKRGATVERVFVMNNSTLEEALALSPVRAHTREANTGLVGYFVDLEYLRKHDRELLDTIGDGFIEIGGRVALIDKFVDTGEVRGYVTMDAAEISLLNRSFEKLKLHSTVLSADILDTPSLPQTPEVSS